MKKSVDGFVWIGLGISLLLALFLSPFASSSPDGLESVAEKKGFSEKAEEAGLWKYAPFRDYTLPRIKNEKISTALSGFVGTLAIFFIVSGIAKLIRKPATKKALFLFPLVLSLTLSPAWAFVTRPLSTDDAGTVEKGGNRTDMVL